MMTTTSVCLYTILNCTVGGAVVVPALAIIMDFDQKICLGTSMAGKTASALMSMRMCVRMCVYPPLHVRCSMILTYCMLCLLLHVLFVRAAAMLPTALSGAAVHLFQGTMMLRQAVPLSVGCLVGSLVGGQFSTYINDTYLRNLFSCTIFGLGVRAVFKAL
jgi:uncharacterized membrane protein YfcA